MGSRTLWGDVRAQAESLRNGIFGCDRQILAADKLTIEFVLQITRHECLESLRRHFKPAHQPLFERF